MVLTRKALIISNPGEIGSETYCEGANKDPLIYKSFLLSGLGGGWLPGEITALKRPSRQEALNAISALKGADYSLVAFCGHGYYSASRNSTILELKAAVELDSVDLRQGATKRTIILDCCRKVYPEIALEAAMEKAIAKADHVVDPSEARRYFDKKLTACAKGLVVLFGCSMGEKAADDSERGGVYSSSLIRGAEEWARTNKTNTSLNYDVLSVVGAHIRATTLVKSLTGKTQNPTIQKPMSDPYFPFAVFV